MYKIKLYCLCMALNPNIELESSIQTYLIRDWSDEECIEMTDNELATAKINHLGCPLFNQEHSGYNEN